MSATAVTIYALSGIVLGCVYTRSTRLRDEPAFQWMTLFGIVSGAALALRTWHPGDAGAVQLTEEGFLFLGAALCHVPVVVYILLSQWNRLIEHLTSPGARDDRECGQRSAEDEWQAIERHQEALRLDPIDTFHRRQLGEAYLRLGLIECALGEFRKAIECLDRGYEHGYLLFKSARIIVDRKKDLDGALPLLRRIIRTYPKSYFAAYARRVVNHYEAHRASPSS